MSQPHDSLDMGELLDMIEDLREKVEKLDGSRANIEVSSKQVNSRKAQINRDLLYAAHLADLVRVDIMSHYHRFKGETPPYITAE